MKLILEIRRQIVCSSLCSFPEHYFHFRFFFPVHFPAQRELEEGAAASLYVHVPAWPLKAGAAINSCEQSPCTIPFFETAFTSLRHFIERGKLDYFRLTAFLHSDSHSNRPNALSLYARNVFSADVTLDILIFMFTASFWSCSGRCNFSLSVPKTQLKMGLASTFCAVPSLYSPISLHSFSHYESSGRWNSVLTDGWSTIPALYTSQRKKNDVEILGWIFRFLFGCWCYSDCFRHI